MRMNLKFSIALTVIILGLVLGYFLNKPKFRNESIDFGKSFNSEREKIGIPKIESNWVAFDIDSIEVTWMNKSHMIETHNAHHFAKHTVTSHGQLISEEDSYNKITNDSVDNRVIYKYHFATKMWNCKLSIHKYRAYPPSRPIDLKLEQADSILKSWDLSRQ
jgi:hypothetical protein